MRNPCQTCRVLVGYIKKLLGAGLNEKRTGFHHLEQYHSVTFVSPDFQPRLPRPVKPLSFSSLKGSGAVSYSAFGSFFTKRPSHPPSPTSCQSRYRFQTQVGRAVLLSRFYIIYCKSRAKLEKERGALTRFSLTLSSRVRGPSLRSHSFLTSALSASRPSAP